MAFTVASPKVRPVPSAPSSSRAVIPSAPTLTQNALYMQLSARPAARAVAARATRKEVAQQAGTAVAAAVLASVVTVGTVDAAYADVAGLTPCSESKGFAKVQKGELKKLDKRMKGVRCAARRRFAARPSCGPIECSNHAFWRSCVQFCRGRAASGAVCTAEVDDAARLASVAPRAASGVDPPVARHSRAGTPAYLRTCCEAILS
jgi:Photosystem I reaction centre subunit III